MPRDDASAGYPAVGSVAPDFTLPASGGAMVRLADFREKKTVVLFFYPKDMTSACTKEACGFRDHYTALKKVGVEVLGISPDPVRQHDRFVEKHDLNFLLLADEDHAVARQYGVWQVKSMFGREYMGIVRTTFIVDKSGRIAHVFTHVKAEGHADEVLAAAVGLRPRK
jgi:peroxiredoxin Q/BCP